MQKILIVEDDVDIQDILKNHLIDAGYEVATASDGVEGIAMFDDTIDLVFYNYISSTGCSLRRNIFFHFKTVTYDILQFDKCGYGESRYAPC